MELSRRDLLRLATIVGSRSALIAASPLLGCAHQTPVRDLISRENVVSTLRELLREKVARLETRYDKAVALTTFTTKTVAVRDRLGHRLDRTQTRDLVFRVFDGEHWHGFGLSTFQADAVSKLVAQIEATIPVRAGVNRSGKPVLSILDVRAENFKRRGHIDLATAKEEQWRQRVSNIHSVLATTGSSRTIYRGCVAESRDELRLLVGGGVDIRQSVGRVRVSAVMISRPGDVAIAEEITSAGSGGLEWISIDRADIEAASTNALILPVGTIPAPLAKTAAVVLAPDVMAAILGNVLAPRLRFSSPAVLGGSSANRNIGSPLVNLIDDPTLASGYPSYDVDDEGVRASRKLLIENGVLSSPITTVDDGPATGHGKVDRDGLLSTRLSNLMMVEGTQSYRDLAGQLSEGLVIEGVETIGASPHDGQLLVRARRAREVRGGALSGRIYGPVSIRASLDQLLSDVSGVSSETGLFLSNTLGNDLNGEFNSRQGDPQAMAIRCPFVLTRATVS